LKPPPRLSLKIKHPKENKYGEAFISKEAIDFIQIFISYTKAPGERKQGITIIRNQLFKLVHFLFLFVASFVVLANIMQKDLF